MSKLLQIIAFYFLINIAQPLAAGGVTRAELLANLQAKLNNESVVSALEAAEEGLRSDDRVIQQMFLEPVLQHKDRRVRQVGLMFLAKNMKSFHIIIEIPSDVEKKISDQQVVARFRDHRDVDFKISGFEEKDAVIKIDRYGVYGKIDQSGISLFTDCCVVNLREAESGYLLGAISMRGASLPAKMPLP